MLARVKHGAPFDPTTLEALSRDNPGWQLETSPEGWLLLSPTSSDNGPRAVELAAQLWIWNRRVGFGKVFDSSSGFTMPDGAILSPDAACVRREIWEHLSNAERTSYAPICPDLCFEIASKTDRWEDVTAKIDRYASYGASYALAIDPRTREVYAVGRPPMGLVLDIAAIIDAAL